MHTFLWHNSAILKIFQCIHSVPQTEDPKSPFFKKLNEREMQGNNS